MTNIDHAGTITFYDPETGQIERTVTGDDVLRLEQLVRIAEAIMRTPPIGVAPRLVDEWREVSQKVEAGR